MKLFRITCSVLGLFAAALPGSAPAAPAPAAAPEADPAPVAATAPAPARASATAGQPAEGKDKEKPAVVTAEDLGKVTAGERAKMLLTYLMKRDRRADFFGLAMDPTKPLAARKIEKVVEENKPSVIDPTLLQEAVQRIQVTGILPKRQQAIIGAQIAEVGTRIDVKQGEVTFKLRISSITGAGVMLQDLETGEIVRAGAINAGMAPGMSTSQQADGQAPGIVPMREKGIVIP